MKKATFIMNLAQSLYYYTNTGNISNPPMTLVVIEKVSPNERMILFFSFVILVLNLNAHHARYPLTCFEETPLCFRLIKVMNDV